MEITITSSLGNTPKTGKRCFWAHINGVILRRKDGVGRLFYSEAAARKAAAQATKN